MILSKKNFLSVLICMLLAITIVGCGSQVKASDKAVSIGKQALTVVDGYLDGTIEYTSAKSQIEKLCDKMSYASDLDTDDEYYSDISVKHYILLISSSMIWDNYDSDLETYEELVEERNKLAECIGEDTR